MAWAADSLAKTGTTGRFSAVICLLDAAVTDLSSVFYLISAPKWSFPDPGLVIRLEWLNFMTLNCLTAGSICTSGNLECCFSRARPAVSFEISENEVLLPPVPLLVRFCCSCSPLTVSGTAFDTITWEFEFALECAPRSFYYCIGCCSRHVYATPPLWCCPFESLLKLDEGTWLGVHC